MIRDIDAYIRREAAVATKRARAAGHRISSYAFRSFINGEWQVIAREHPEVAPMKMQFMELAR